MKKVLVDCRINCESIKTLENMGYSVIKVPKSPLFDESICAHPDIFATKVGENLFIDSTLVHLFDCDESKKIYFTNREANTEKTLKYPKDIEFNCAVVGNNIICNEKHTNENIKNFAKLNSINIINVKQGYAKCSVCVVSDNAIITEDESIEKEAKKNGIYVLRISKGHVYLSGYDYGFIGGASGLLENGLLAFNGKISSHPEFFKIQEFCIEHCVKTIELCDQEMCDVGSIISF